MKLGAADFYSSDMLGYFIINLQNTRGADNGFILNKNSQK